MTEFSFDLFIPPQFDLFIPPFHTISEFLNKSHVILENLVILLDVQLGGCVHDIHLGNVLHEPQF